MASTIGMIKVASAQEVMDEDYPESEDNVVFLEDLMDGLAKHVRECYDEARRHKRKDAKRFREAAYARRGQYTPEKLAEIRKTGASAEYARIVANKSRILESWLKDVFLSADERPWSVGATPSPTIPESDMARLREEISMELAQLIQRGQVIDPQAAQQMMTDRIDMERLRRKDLADRRAERMEATIADQLHEGNFEAAAAEFLSYLVTYPSAVFKGPVFRSKDRVNWEETDGTYIPVVNREIIMEFEAVDPNNFYPAPGIQDPQQGYVIEHITLTNADLYDLLNMGEDSGYDEAAIRSVLDIAGDKGLRWLHHLEQSDVGGSESNQSDVRSNAENTGYIDMLEYHGPVRGAKLVEWGMEDIEDEQEYYEATVYLIDKYVIKAVLNDDPMGRRPYYKSSYEEIPGEFWGYSLYDVLSDVQGVGNAAIRSLVNNMAIASGPQVVVNTDRMPAGEDVTNMYPWKIWQVTDSQFSNTSQRAIDFYQPNTNSQELMSVLDKFYALADDFSLIPRYMSGSDKISGPGRTATGLSMLLDAANKGLKSIVQGVDTNVMTPLLEQLFDYNMLYSDDDSIKGDSQVVARGVASLMQLETLRMRRNEFLQITNNPVDSQIVGMRGRASVLREIAKSLGMDVNKIVPPESQLQTQQPALPPPQGQPQQPQQVGSEEQLGNGAPTADTASPSQMM